MINDIDARILSVAREWYDAVSECEYYADHAFNLMCYRREAREKMKELKAILAHDHELRETQEAAQ